MKEVDVSVEAVVRAGYGSFNFGGKPEHGENVPLENVPMIDTEVFWQAYLDEHFLSDSVPASENQSRYEAADFGVSTYRGKSIADVAAMQALGKLRYWYDRRYISDEEGGRMVIRFDEARKNNRW